jgi:hypothetical protein
MVLRRSSEILPIVTVIAAALVMFELVERTKHSFEMENKKISIFF